MYSCSQPGKSCVFPKMETVDKLSLAMDFSSYGGGKKSCTSWVTQLVTMIHYWYYIFDKIVTNH